MSKNKDVAYDMMPISMDLIRIRDDKLRDVDKSNPDKWNGFVNSIRMYGVLQPIRVIKDPDKQGHFIIDDGLHRFTGAKEAGLTEIPATISQGGTDDIVFTQIIQNIQRFEQKPIQLSKALHRIVQLPQYENMTQKEILASLGQEKSPTWMDNTLRLNDLIPEAQALVTEGEIPVSKAYALARLPADEQVHWTERAQNMEVGEFVKDVEARYLELKKEAQGQAPTVVDPLKAARRRPVSELKAKFVELEEKVTNPSLSEIQKAYFSGQFEAIQWAMFLDPEFVNKKEAEKAERAKQREEFAIKRKEIMAQARENAKKMLEGVAVPT